MNIIGLSLDSYSQHREFWSFVRTSPALTETAKHWGRMDPTLFGTKWPHLGKRCDAVWSCENNLRIKMRLSLSLSLCADVIRGFFKKCIYRYMHVPVLQININKYLSYGCLEKLFLIRWLLNQQLLFFKLNRVALGAHHVIFLFFGFFFCYVNQILLRIYGNYVMEKSEFTLKLYR